MLPDTAVRRKYILSQPFEKCEGCFMFDYIHSPIPLFGTGWNWGGVVSCFISVPGFHTSMAHSDMNTEAKTIKMSGMNHTEGGWPEHVRTEMIEHKNKFIRFINFRI